MIRLGRVTRFVLRHFLRDGLPSDRELSLSTAELKAMRQMRRQTQKQGLAQMYAASRKLGLYDGELDSDPRRPVPVLTNAQEAFLTGISTSGNFKLEKVLQRHASIREHK
jgi:hypothetical protein